MLYDSYNRSNAYFLEDVYTSYSRAKLEAFKRCKTLWLNDLIFYENRGEVGSMRIISSNSFTFSVAWTISTEDYEYLHVITPTKNYVFEVACYV